MPFSKRIIMKKYTAIVLLLFSTTILRAQTFSEWFRQKKTQIKYLKEQILAFKVYGDYTRKGYEVAKNGLTFIQASKDGGFLQHYDYFTSLISVNPCIKAYWKVADMILLGRRILQIHQKQKQQIEKSGQFTAKEADYINTVFTDLLQECSAVLEELTRLTSDGTYEMKDNERLKRIDVLHADLQDQYAFAKHFESQAELFALQRLQESTNVSISRQLYGIH